MGNTTMLFILIVCILVVYSLMSSIANARTDQRYGVGEHTLVVTYTKGEPTVYNSCDEGELHELRDYALGKRNVRSVAITYANGEQECITK